MGAQRRSQEARAGVPAVVRPVVRVIHPAVARAGARRAAPVPPRHSPSESGGLLLLLPIATGTGSVKVVCVRVNVDVTGGRVLVMVVVRQVDVPRVAHEGAGT